MTEAQHPFLYRNTFYTGLKLLEAEYIDDRSFIWVELLGHFFLVQWVREISSGALT